jgi:phosphopantothenoylcysteine decarboxylase/phosphopantothenate--cysteine ligase
VVLGVTGSIAAYKAAEIASSLTKAGVDVHVIMTDSATKLVQPQTFFTLSRNPVVTSLWEAPEWEPEHIALAERAALLVIAPATANTLAKMAHGIADDALSSYVVSHSGPVMVAPAMNPRMWKQAAVQANVEILKQRGVQVIGPDSGIVACGDVGTGRFVAPAVVVNAVRAQIEARKLASALAADGVPFKRRKIVVSAGPTREALDPVRCLTNRSSGRMGYAIASVAAQAGHEVVLVSGPVNLPRPAGCRVVEVESTAEMAAAVKAEFAQADLLIMSAAPADYRPAEAATEKIKKTGTALVLKLEPTEDILGAVAKLKKPRQKVAGFAAETERVAEFAKAKLAKKKLDWIVANDVSRSDIGFDSEQNEVEVHTAAGATIGLPKMDKLALAGRLLALFLR